MDWSDAGEEIGLIGEELGHVKQELEGEIERLKKQLCDGLRILAAITTQYGGSQVDTQGNIKYSLLVDDRELCNVAYDDIIRGYRDEKSESTVIEVHRKRYN